MCGLDLRIRERIEGIGIGEREFGELYFDSFGQALRSDRFWDKRSEVQESAFGFR